MAEPQQPIVQTPANTQQQVTSIAPATKQKNPKRVAAGKAIAERTRIAREAQKKVLIEAQSIIAQAKQADPVADSPSPPAEPPAQVAEPPSAKVLTTTQWLSVISIIVSLVGVYYKREEIKNVFGKKAAPQSPVLPTPSHVDAAPKTAIRTMD